MYCKYCGKETENENNVCNECSNEVVEAVKVEESTSVNDKKGSGTASLILGIVSIVLGNIICAVIAIVLGVKAVNTQTEKNGKIGKILGIVGIVIWAISLIVSFIIMPIFIEQFAKYLNI